MYNYETGKVVLCNDLLCINGNLVCLFNGSYKYIAIQIWSLYCVHREREGGGEKERERERERDVRGR